MTAKTQSASANEIAALTTTAPTELPAETLDRVTAGSVNPCRNFQFKVPFANPSPTP